MNTRSAILVTIGLILLTSLAIGAVMLSRQQASQPQQVTPLPTNADMLAEDIGQEVNTQDVGYIQGVTGYYAAPAKAGVYPGVVMIHEWWGLNDTMKDMARQLAGEGYQVLAVDLYHGIVAKTQDEARAQVSGLKQDEALANLRAAVTYLREHSASKIASLGWCFGGGQSLQLALSGEKLNATVIYYGTLTSDRKKLTALKWPVLGIFGEKDTSIPVESVAAFQESLKKLKIPNDITIYPGVGHAFANPTGANYAPDETKDAWDKTLSFLSENLKTD